VNKPALDIFGSDDIDRGESNRASLVTRSVRNLKQGTVDRLTGGRGTSLLGAIENLNIEKKPKREVHSFDVKNKQGKVCSFTVDKHYQYVKILGQGAYGFVIAATDSRTRELVAIKNVQDAFRDTTDAKRILREIRLMCFMDHHNVMKLRDLIPPKYGFNDLYLVAEVMESDLHLVLKERELSDDIICWFIYQMLCGINYMHSAGILHRDLKPSNILISSTCDLKITDFGLSRGVGKKDDQKPLSPLTEYVVTRWYRAPELILLAEYGPKIDVFAAGCIMAEMFTRRPLFPGSDYMNQLSCYFKVLGSPTKDELHFVTHDKALKFVLGLPKYPKKDWRTVCKRASPACIEILDSMTKVDPKQRTDIAPLFSHRYFKNVRDEKDEYISDCSFDFSYEEGIDLTADVLRDLIWDDIKSFHVEVANDWRDADKDNDDIIEEDLDFASDFELDQDHVETPLATRLSQRVRK